MTVVDDLAIGISCGSIYDRFRQLPIIKLTILSFHVALRRMRPIDIFLEVSLPWLYLILDMFGGTFLGTEVFANDRQNFFTEPKRCTIMINKWKYRRCQPRID